MKEAWWVRQWMDGLAWIGATKRWYNHASRQVLGMKLPNAFGRAEKLTFQFSYGTKETSYGLSFFKPQVGNFERK